MLPFESDSTSRRNINLGGTPSQSSQAALLNRARVLRDARRDERNKEVAALKIKNWLLSQRGIQVVRAELRTQFDLGPQDYGLSVEDERLDQAFLAWTRLLLLCGADETRLYQWSMTMMNRGWDSIISSLVGPQKDSWLFLMRRVGVLLLRKVAQNSTSDKALLLLQFLDTLISPSSWTTAASVDIPVDITVYLLQNSMFLHVGSAFQQMPTRMKTTTQHAVYLSRLVVSTFSHLSGRSASYASACLDFFEHVLSVPLLPNRVPLKELPLFVSRIPWADLPLSTSQPGTALFSKTLNDLVLSIPTSLWPHVLANIIAFLSPRYTKLPSAALASYLELYAELLDCMSPKQLEIKRIKQEISTSSSVPKPSVVRDDFDSDDEEGMDIDIQPPPNEATVPPSGDAVVPLDSRTLSRLSNLTTATHITSLLSATARHPNARPQLFRFIFSLTVSIPSKKEHIWTTISVSPGGGAGLIRECWRGHVRSSPLGKVQDDGATKVLMDPAHASAWPSLLLLVSLYSQALLTMGDDEFFSLSATTPNTARNPLTVDDLIVFSRQLLNIAFPLYWFEDQARVKESGPVGIRMTWEKIREVVSNCLKGIHARDSRRPFTPPGHWLLTSQLDLRSFIDAAIVEEQTLSSGDSEGPAIPSSQHRRNGLSPRQIAQLSPRLGILNNIPFAIPFEVRVEIFRRFIHNDFLRTFRERNDAINPAFVADAIFNRPRRKRAVVRRGRIAEDGFDQLSGMGSDLKGPVEIQFIDQFGQEEAGIDGGGVFKEFLTSLSREAFDTNRGLWLATQQQELYPNPHSYATEPHQLNWYRFIGRILGKALYEGILVDVAFAPFFLAKWLGKQSYLDDLASLDRELYNGLIFLKHYDKNFEDLSLNFTITAEDLGVSRTVNLIPNGDQISVTKENRLQYIYLVSHYRLSRQIKRQSEAFFDGLSDIIDPKWLRMFNQQEVQILVGGVDTPVDLDDLRQNCNYGGLYDDNHETIVLFWKVVNSFNQEERRGLLRFVTSCGRPPLLGFKELYPKFSIRDSSNDEQRLPTSSTCVNLLKLPRYQSERVMREKLIQAIFSGAGFDLS